VHGEWTGRETWRIFAGEGGLNELAGVHGFVGVVSFRKSSILWNVR
jgi:hypothetical protein